MSEDKSRPDYPKGPLDGPNQETVAVRVGISVRFYGSTDVLLEKADIERYGSIDALIQRRREDLAQQVWEQGGSSEDDVEIDDLDQWDDNTFRWEIVEADD